MINAVIKGNQNTTKLINELKRAEKQYPPLSKEQEERLIAENKNDRDKLNHLLFMHNIRLVFNVAKKYAKRTDDFDSMVQDGMLGLMIAAQNFDLDRNIKFITYATPWVKKKVLEQFYYKAAEVIKRSTSINAPITGGNSKINDNDSGEFEDYINDYIDTSVMKVESLYNKLSANEQSELCSYLYDNLDRDPDFSDKDKKIFYDVMKNKENIQNIQFMYGVTNDYVRDLKKKIFKNMKSILKEKYHITSYRDIAV